MTTQTFSQRIVRVECCRCGIPFGMSETLEAVRRADHQNFYCPLGHPQHWPEGKTREQKLRERIDAEAARASRLVAQLDQERAEHETTKREKAAAKGQVTKLKKRIGRGVCPCCNRHFENVDRHMASKHPEFHDGAVSS